MVAGRLGDISVRGTGVPGRNSHDSMLWCRFWAIRRGPSAALYPLLAMPAIPTTGLARSSGIILAVGMKAFREGFVA